MIERFDLSVFRNFLRSNLIDIPVVLLDKTDSTNKNAKDYCREGKSCPFVVISESQYQGRGTKGRSFFSPSGGVYFTLCISHDSDCFDSTIITPMAAVAASFATDSVSSRESLIKWVNDIYLDNKKACGILCETSFKKEQSKSDIYIGVGANIYPPDDMFPDEINNTATTMCQTDIAFMREKFVAEFINRFFELYNSSDKLYNQYLCKSLVVGRDIAVIKKDCKLAARAVGISDDFSLHVQYEDGSFESLLSDEVSIKI